VNLCPTLPSSSAKCI